MRTASNPVPWQILLAIARGKSLSEAADMSGVDSGMGSRMISSLEADLRLTLLDRTTKPVKLSEVAYRLLPRVMEFLDRYEALLAEARAQVDERLHESAIRLSVPGNIPRLAVISITNEYQQSHPDTVFEIYSECDHTDILAGRIDIAALPYRPKDERLSCIPLSRTTTFLAASPDYLAEAGGVESPEDLVARRLILRSGPHYPKTQFLVSEEEAFDFTTGMRMALPIKDSAVLEPYERNAYLSLYIRQQQSRFLSQKGVTDYFYGDAQSCLQAALEGVGICVDVSVGLLVPYFKSGRLVPVLPHWHRPLWNLTLVVLKRGLVNKNLKEFAIWYAEQESRHSRERLRTAFKQQGLTPEKLLANGF